MENVHFSLTSLLIVTILSFLVPILIRKIKQIYIPVVVGEILVGMIIGKSGFDLIVMDEWLQFIQFFGLAYLMFVAGLEIDFEIFTNQEEKQKASKLLNPITLSLVMLGITLFLAYLVSILLRSMGFIKDPLLMALIVGTTSLSVVMPVLKERKLSNTRFGQYIITGAVIADFVTMLLISVAVSIFKGGFSVKILFVFALLGLVLFFYRVSHRFQGNPIFQELAHGTTQIGIRGSFALMLIFLVLAQAIGVEMILGSFLAGVVVSLIGDPTRREEIVHKLDAIGFGFLIPTFFILVGVNFDASVLINNPRGLLLVPLLFIIVYIVKGLPVLLFKFLFPWRETIAGSIILSTQMSVTIAAATIGVNIGAISNEANAAIVLVAILTSIISPILFGKLIPIVEKKEEDHYVLIIGATRNAILLAKRFLNSGIKVFMVDSDEEKVHETMMSGLNVIWGNALDPELIEQFEAEKVRAIVVLTGNDQVNFEIAHFLSYYFSSHIYVVLNDPTLMEKAKKMEKIRPLNPQLSTVSLLENMIKHPVTADILEDRLGLHMEEIEIWDKRLIGKTVRNLKIFADILLVSIYRKGETILPHGDTEIEEGDILLILGTKETIEQFKNTLYI
ncbi:monovalent cation:proton antiporter family protein [Tepidibacillus sp. LV47]|uniref:monovalent cation:proton antiporter family protein n=1 Tax=Tepidibacillus sp. LV47 TaxID=3398228 RepID=UPI003AABB271